MEDRKLEYILCVTDTRLKRRVYLGTFSDMMTAAYRAVADAASYFTVEVGASKIYTIDTSDFKQMTQNETAFQVMISSKSGRQIIYTYVIEVHAIPEQKRLFNI